jgi:tRNA pseudouridine55 synthase
VSELRRVLGIKRIGHTGTLDPFATGLMVILVGRATRLSRFLAGLRKAYTGTIVLGVTTDTDDATGQVTSRQDGCGDLSADRIGQAMLGLTGRYAQRPPAYSAKKVQGERAYRRARRGEEFELTSSDIVVHEFRFLEVSGHEIRFDCEVGGGTYVRALARDLGERLGCGAHLKALRRVSVGRFDVEQAVPVTEISANAPLGDAVRLVAHLEAVQLDPATRMKVSHGHPVPASDIARGFVALVAGGDLVAVAESDGELLRPRVVLEG